MLLIELFFFSLIKVQAAADPTVESSAILPLVVVEGQRLTTTKSENVESVEGSLISVTSGLGAKEIDPPKNELGVSLLTMENEEDISLQRRMESWLLLTPARQSEVWRQQAQLGLASNPSLKARLLSEQLQQKRNIEFGYIQDHRLVKQRENSGNPYDSTQGNVIEYRNRLDQSYVKINGQWNQLETLLDADSQSKDIYLGSELTGVSKINQQELNLRWIEGNYQALSFAHWRQSEFKSSANALSSSKTKGLRFGGSIVFANASAVDRLEAGVSHETLHRNLADDLKSEFQRQKLSLVGAKSVESSSLETRWHFKADSAQDEVKGVDGSLGSSPQKTFNEPLAWDFGLEISTPSNNDIGLVGRLRRFALLPTPTQRFGDGVLLQGSAKLEQEVGIRASAGPWWSNDLGRVEFMPFFEQTENEPIAVAISPWAARTLAIGSVVSRGIELKVLSELRSFKITFVYSYQEALNNSSVQWQKGLAIPGRPAHSLQSELQYQKRRWKSGISYGYQSADAMDLSGLWFKSPHHDLNTYLGYGTKSWEMRLVGAKLMANSNELPTTLYSGKAGVDLLEPMLEQTEIKLLCEIML